MKKILFVLFLLLLTSPVSALISLSPSSLELYVCSDFQVNVDISGANNVYGFQFDLTYNSNVLEVVSVSEGSFLNNNGLDPTFWLAPDVSVLGLISNLACSRTGSGSMSGSGTLATITFRVKSISTFPATSTLVFGNVKVSDSNTQPLDNSSQNGLVTIYECQDRIPVPSAGCCIYDAIGGSCESQPDENSCSLIPLYFVEVSCNSYCALGCCCPPGYNTGTGSTNYSCQDPSTFVLDSSVEIGLGCACVDEAYNVSGTITRLGGGSINGATVSAGGRITTSASDGTYTLTNVPAGINVLVSAVKDGCLPGSTTIANLDSNKTGINIQLSCVCAPGICEPVNNAHCTSQGWTLYNLSAPSQKAIYCSYCAVEDPDDCGPIDNCVDNDSSCPLTCSPDLISPDYDSDCVCSMTPNSVCPAWCDIDTDADCDIYSAVCGDGIVTYPYETCEDNPAPGQVSRCGADDCVNCNCVGLSDCGNQVLDPGEDCELGAVCSDGSPCVDCKCGEPPCTGDALNPSLIAGFDASATPRRILVSWYVPSNCNSSVLTYLLFRCEASGGNTCSSKLTGFRFLLSTSNTQHPDEYNINQNSDYCYFVRAIYYINGGIEIGESVIDCVSTGHYYCMEPHPEEFCWDNFRSHCDANYNIMHIEDCSAYSPKKRFCMGPNIDGNTWCAESGICDQCNGLYGMYSNIDLRVIVEEGGYNWTKYCHYDPTKPYRFVVEGCYLDRTKTLFSAFDYCAYITSCYDYKSYDACTGDNYPPEHQDPCGKNQGCEWVWLDDANIPPYKGTGGICRPFDPDLQQCELCDDKSYNWLSPDCTPEVCKLFGEECYYQGRFSQEPCADKSTLSCLDLPTQEDCIGGTPVFVDANYDNDGNRISGTHQLTPSNDKFDLGKCYWHVYDGSGVCLRNADNYPESNIGYDFDCDLGKYDCESDFSNPETTILPSGFAVYPADVKISFSVSDEYYADNVITTYFCIAPYPNTCYPTELATNGTYEKTLNTSGDYIVYYYSQDCAKNLEVVKNISIQVDADLPEINIISPPSEQQFPTAQNYVDISGTASLDTKYLCTYTFGSNIKNCTSNCIYGQVPPCINSTTGAFDISVEVPSNGMYDILFDAEDFAGNQVIGLSLLSIYRNDTEPREPIIIIEEAS